MRTQLLKTSFRFYGINEFCEKLRLCISRTACAAGVSLCIRNGQRRHQNEGKMYLNCDHEQFSMDFSALFAHNFKWKIHLILVLVLKQTNNRSLIVFYMKYLLKVRTEKWKEATFNGSLWILLVFFCSSRHSLNGILWFGPKEIDFFPSLSLPQRSAVRRFYSLFVLCYFVFWFWFWFMQNC